MEIVRDFATIIRQRLSRFEPLIQILVGPRQIGKSTAAREFVAAHPDKAIYLALDNPGPDAEELVRFTWQKARAIKGHKILILDEVQNLENWSALVKELYDQDRHKGELSLLLLGSSALDLALRGEESLQGRFEIIRAHHWNAYESKEAFGWELPLFLQMGGYPVLGSIIKEDAPETLKRGQAFIRDSIIEPVITRDILTLRSAINSSLLRQTLEICLSAPCQEISFTKILGQLSDRGNATTIKSYLELLEKTFFIKLLYRYSGTVIRSRTSSPKIVPLAPALCHAFISPSKVEEDPAWYGKVFEAAIISRLNSLDAQLYYWSNSKEDVDVVIKQSDQVIALEIKSNSSHDWRGLRAFKKQFPQAKIASINSSAGERILTAASAEDAFEELKQHAI